MIPSSGQNGLSRFESLSSRFPFRITLSSGASAAAGAVDLVRLLVVAQAEVRGMAQVAVVRPLAVAHLRDELRLDPLHVALADARHLRRLGERRRVAMQRLQEREQPADLGVVEPGADIPDVAQRAALVHGEHERAEGAGAAARACACSRRRRTRRCSPSSASASRACGARTCRSSRRASRRSLRGAGRVRPRTARRRRRIPRRRRPSRRAGRSASSAGPCARAAAGRRADWPSSSSRSNA